ncbi:hypothetical protein L211DRAFT_204556 [Terfezia boudieri ATCC MYA-4762]|uniref:Phospholipid/glycerol acyltransferase domain-containing protein n=1 Tax=Terfezia boudieri ATCC MYA-4762 TaxID=1051890 RepID=A0A3N4LS55_9PEZI|nr:hypothetical protein L211DRAFT_204556 [Terfezia boudieri ATCC MYA-4762]
MPGQNVYQPAKFKPMVNWIYDVLLWLFSVLVDLFFREVHPRGSFRIPRRGPVIFVAAPHANQFVDPLILMRVVRAEAKRRICFLVAEKSMRRKFIGWFSRSVGALPVARALDMTKPGTGRIYISDITTREGRLHVYGAGTKFTQETSQSELIVLPTIKGQEKAGTASAEVAEVISDEELILKKEFKGGPWESQLTYDGDDGRGSKYKAAPKVDQTQVYDAVFQRLNEGGCIGIFPEGGSHDRTELLPLKGVAIMALGALAANPRCGLKIVPCGMNYFHAHKFRSRAVIEFGSPLDVPEELVEQYRRGERRDAVKQLLEILYHSLVSVTVTSPDYDTLMVIQAVRRLYKPIHRKLPLPMVMELNRRLVSGYTQFKDDPRIIKLRANVTAYNRELRLMNLRDHQVEYAKFSLPQIWWMLTYRLWKLALLGLGALPGSIMFAPVFIAAKVISVKKAEEALKASTVKIQGRDVIATWKLLVAMAFAPILYQVYVITLVYWTYKHRIFGFAPDWLPLWSVPIIGWILFPTITFSSLRFGEVGMDIFKSLRPLLLSLKPSSANSLEKLRKRREELSVEVTEVINTLGPEVFPDFEETRLLANPLTEEHSQAAGEKEKYQYGLTYTTQGYQLPDVYVHPGSGGYSYLVDSHIPNAHKSGSHLIPRNESFGNLSNIALFASRPASRARSRSNSGRHDFGGFAKLSAMSDKKGGDVAGTEADTADAIVTSIGDKFTERRRERARRKSECEYDLKGEEERDGDEGSETGVSVDSEADIVEIRKRK